jgi:glycerate 2-kinase
VNAIKNKGQLIAQGETEVLKRARAFALESLEHALEAVDPKKLLRAKLQLKGSCLQVDGLSFDRSRFKHIYVVGGGKASGGMAQALEEALGNCITSGIVNVPYGSPKHTNRVELHEASHPIPDQAGVEGTRRMVALAEQAEKDDLVICLLSGGGSSLMPLLREGISLKDKQTLNNALLKSGANINEVNAVRKHLSAFKGGQLAKKAYPATVLNLILSDVIGDPLDVIASGPTVSDGSTFADARRVLEKYGLWLKAPGSVRKLLEDGVAGLVDETPKADDAIFQKVHNVVIGNNHTATTAALECLNLQGLNATLLSSPLEGEARRVGSVFALVAREAKASGCLCGKPVGIVAGGETTVTVKGPGLGGRNQEFALSAALQLAGVEGCVLASLSTDGVDGPTDAAGAIVDKYTVKRARTIGLKPESFLTKNDSYHFFDKLDDLIFTGQTGTNVNDISVIVLL